MFENLLYWVIMFVLLAFPFFYLRAVKNFSWQKTIADLLPKPQNWKKELLGTAKLLALLLLVYVVVFAILTIVGLNDLDKVQSALTEQIKSGWPVLVLTFIVVLFIEELFFRAFLVKRIGVIPSTIVFAAAHFGYGSIAEIIGVLALGLVLSYWYKKNNSLTQNYLAHLFYDLIALALYLV